MSMGKINCKPPILSTCFNTLLTLGSKRSRRKPNKVLGRSPLTILQDDNSPGTLTPRQGKRPSPLSENVRELKEGAILGTGRLLKTGGRAWEQGQDHDKENQHFALVES
ncbi:Hypothetical predicted protein [Marmota monax]|uniref:Cell division cycle-associated protein 3 n=1 Tax=Marmota monax TaxID=9995 RepID=A0A5E4B4A8_MARMO|nr:hypothetical protein GHT09_019621 [Marmota monax]VTJ64587.1 Hypothetical predicted protein [Marmota monax]